MLHSVHLAGAFILKTPQLALDESESKQLADAISQVSELYDVPIDPRAVAWGNLIMVAGTIYVPRIIAIKNEAKHNKASNKRPEPNNVVHLGVHDVTAAHA
jgi:hypothetical protein